MTSERLEVGCMPLRTKVPLTRTCQPGGSTCEFRGIGSLPADAVPHELRRQRDSSMPVQLYRQNARSISWLIDKNIGTSICANIVSTRDMYPPLLHVNRKMSVRLVVQHRSFASRPKIFASVPSFANFQSPLHLSSAPLARETPASLENSRRTSADVAPLAGPEPRPRLSSPSTPGENSTRTTFTGTLRSLRDFAACRTSAIRYEALEAAKYEKG